MQQFCLYPREIIKDISSKNVNYLIACKWKAGNKCLKIGYVTAILCDKNNIVTFEMWKNVQDTRMDGQKEGCYRATSFPVSKKTTSEHTNKHAWGG